MEIWKYMEIWSLQIEHSFFMCLQHHSNLVSLVFTALATNSWPSTAALRTLVQSMKFSNSFWRCIESWDWCNPGTVFSGAKKQGFSQQTMWISPVNMMTLSMNNGKLVWWFCGRLLFDQTNMFINGPWFSVRRLYHMFFSLTHCWTGYGSELDTPKVGWLILRTNIVETLKHR